MPIYDGDNLIVTLDSGVTEVDVREDIYEGWKDWLLGNNSNMKYPQLFRPVGGDPLSSIINAGSYFFLNNKAGWRIKPPEENITIYLTGNLAVEDTGLDALIPTTGTFTAAVLGLQPVTQGVTENMASQLAFNTFQNEVNIDIVNGYAGTGEINGNLIGTRRAPSNNMVDSHIILDREGLHIFNIISSMPIFDEDLSDGHEITGDSRATVLTINPSADVSNCSFDTLTIEGELDGINALRRCDIGAITNVSGIIENSAFKSTVTLNGDLDMYGCYSQVEGGGYPVFTAGSHNLVARDHHGSFGLAGATTGHVSSIGVYGGRFISEVSNVDAEIHIRGNPFEIVEHQSSDIIIDETEGQKVRAIHGQVSRKVFIDTELSVNGNGYQQTPFNNFTSAVDYAEANGLRELVILSDATIDRQLKNFIITGVGTPTIDCNGQNLNRSEINRCTVTGLYTGVIILQESKITGTFSLNGFFENCAISSNVIVPDGGIAFVKDCSSFVVGQVQPIFDVGGIAGTGVLIVSGYDGGMNLINVNQPTDDVKLINNVSKVVIDNTCSDGTINVGGVTRLLGEGTGSTIIDETIDAIHVDELWKRLDLDKNNPVLHSDTSIVGGGINILITDNLDGTFTAARQ